MQDKEFNELLEALGRKDEKAEGEPVTKSQTEIKTHKAHVGGTYYDRWLEAMNERKGL